MGWVVRGILVKFSQKANKVFKIPKENGMVRQAKLGRANRMKGSCTATKTTCR